MLVVIHASTHVRALIFILFYLFVGGELPTVSLYFF